MIVISVTVNACLFLLTIFNIMSPFCFSGRAMKQSSSSFRYPETRSSSATGRLGRTVDVTANAVPTLTNKSNVMVDSTALIEVATSGRITTAAQEYMLQNKTSEGILTINSKPATNVVRHASDDGTVVTVLTLTKPLETSVPTLGTGGSIRREGTNVFLWAVGPSLPSTNWTIHTTKGVVLLDLAQVQKRFERPSSSTTEEPPIVNTSSVVHGDCGTSSILDSGNMVQLTPTVAFRCKLLADRTIQIALDYTGREQVWLDVRVSQHGKMVKSTAIIGIPGDDVMTMPPRQNTLQDQVMSGVVPDETVETSPVNWMVDWIVPCYDIQKCGTMSTVKCPFDWTTNFPHFCMPSVVTVNWSIMNIVDHFGSIYNFLRLCLHGTWV